jgi:hypothetical protein
VSVNLVKGVGVLDQEVHAAKNETTASLSALLNISLLTIYHLPVLA